MAKNKRLKSVAYGLASHFVSQYNRINGHWAIGEIYSRAQKQKTKYIAIDLLNSKKIPSEIELYHLVAYFNLYLYYLLDNHNLNDSCIKKASLTITFNVARKESDPLESAVGNPCICEVLLLDNKNKIYQILVRDYCMESCPWGRYSIHEIDKYNKFELYLNNKKNNSLKNLIGK